MKIRLSGGFHNVSGINLIVPEDFETRIKEESIYTILSKNQLYRANRHFCGMTDCCCGGVARATIEVISKK